MPACLFRGSANVAFAATVAATLLASACREAVEASGADDPASLSQAVVSGESGAPAPALVATTTASEEVLAVAVSGGRGVAVWRDPVPGTNVSRLVAGRVSATGALLDPSGVLVPIPAGRVASADLASDGANLLLVFQFEPQGQPGPGNPPFLTPDVLAIRLGPDLAPLDASPIPISNHSWGEKSPAVAFNGTDFVVAWTDDAPGSGGDIKAVLVTPAGDLQANPTALSSETRREGFPDVACASGGCLVTWLDEVERHTTAGTGLVSLKARRIGAAGEFLEASATTISETAHESRASFVFDGSYGTTAPAVASDGAGYLVAWEDDRHATTSNPLWDAYAARLSPSATPLGTSRLTTTSGTRLAPVVVARQGGWLVSWTELATNARRLVAPLDSDGTLAGSPVSFPATSSLMASDRTSVLAAWGVSVPAPTCGGSPCGNPSTDVHASWIGASGAPVVEGGLRLTNDAADRTVLASACGADRYLVVWHEAPSALRGIVVAGDGGTSPAAPIPISDAASADATVAFDGTNFLVAWSDFRSGRGDVFGRRIAPDGRALDAASIPIAATASDERAPSISFGASHYLVVWAADLALKGARVATTGVVQDRTPLPIAPGTGGTAIDSAPAVSFDGTNWLVVSSSIRSMRVGPNGNVLDAAATSIGDCNDIAGNTLLCRARVAFDGTNHLVVWHARDGQGAYRVMGTWLSKANEKLGASFVVAEGAYRRRYPDVAFDGRDYLVAWTDFRHTLTETIPGAGQVYAAGVTKAGKVLPPNGYLLGAEGSLGSSAALASNRTGSVLAAYSATAPRAASAWLDARFRFVSPPPPGTRGARCSAASECSDGFCVDGVCCNSACGGGVDTDCQACSLEAGATSDGTCGPVRAQTVCRAGSGTCDEVEVCDGFGIACPDDTQLEDGVSCDDPGGRKGRCASGTCEFGWAGMGCDGGFECRSTFCVDGVCCEEACGGNDRTDCQACGRAGGAPADGTCVALPRTHLCGARAGTNECDADDYCDGISTECLEQFKEDSQSCRGGAGQCRAGACEVRDAGQPGPADGGDAGEPFDGGVEWTAQDRLPELPPLDCQCGFGGASLGWLAGFLLLFARRRGRRTLPFVVLAAVAFAAPARAEGKKFAAVLALEPNGAGIDPTMLRAFEEEIRTDSGDILAPLGYTVLNSTNMIALLEENGIDPTKACDTSCSLETARELEARIFLSGTISRGEGLFFVIVRFNESEGGRQLASMKLEGATFRELRAKFAAKSSEFFRKVLLELGELVVAVRFESTPPGASVLLDDQKLCDATPCARELAAGPRTIAMRLEDHEDAVSKQVLDSNRTVALVLNRTERARETERLQGPRSFFGATAGTNWSAPIRPVDVSVFYFALSNDRSDRRVTCGPLLGFSLDSMGAPEPNVIPAQDANGDEGDFTALVKTAALNTHLLCGQGVYFKGGLDVIYAFRQKPEIIRGEWEGWNLGVTLGGGFMLPIGRTRWGLFWGTRLVAGPMEGGAFGQLLVGF